MTDDLISRQAAIDALAKFVPYAICDESTESYTNGLTDAYNLICQLPSAQPERKGRWIKLDMHAHLANHKCTACGQECYVPTCMGEPMYTYCPNCGALMDEEVEGKKK